jgi:hypothetical protein
VRVNVRQITTHKASDRAKAIAAIMTSSSAHADPSVRIVYESEAYSSPSLPKFPQGLVRARNRFLAATFLHMTAKEWSFYMAIPKGFEPLT